MQADVRHNSSEMQARTMPSQRRAIVNGDSVMNFDCQIPPVHYLATEDTEFTEEN